MDVLDFCIECEFDKTDNKVSCLKCPYDMEIDGEICINIECLEG